MKKVLVLMVAFLYVLTSCGQAVEAQDNNEPVVEESTEEADDNNEEVVTEKMSVMTTLFPQYDFAKKIVGDKMEVSLLLPPGLEAHSYEPTPQDIISVGESNVFLYTGEVMEPWAHDLLESLDNQDLKVVDLSEHVTLIEGHHDHDHDDEDHDHDHETDEAHDDHDHDDEDHDHETEEAHDDHDHAHGEFDPHFWMDPHNAMIMVDDILSAVVELDAENKEFYEDNAAELKAELEGLDKALLDLNLQGKDMIFAGHNVIGYLTERYGIHVVSPYAGFSPDAEPTAQAIAEMIDIQQETGSNVIYHEELVEPRVAEAISEATGAEMMLLHGLHNLSPEDFDAGKTYVEIMKENIEKIKLGLE